MAGPEAVEGHSRSRSAPAHGARRQADGQEMRRDRGQEDDATPRPSRTDTRLRCHARQDVLRRRRATVHWQRQSVPELQRGARDLGRGSGSHQRLEGEVLEQSVEGHRAHCSRMIRPSNDGRPRVDQYTQGFVLQRPPTQIAEESIVENRQIVCTFAWCLFLLIIPFLFLLCLWGTRMTAGKGVEKQLGVEKAVGLSLQFLGYPNLHFTYYQMQKVGFTIQSD